MDDKLRTKLRERISDIVSLKVADIVDPAAALPVGVNALTWGRGFDSVTGETRAPGVKWNGDRPDIPALDLKQGRIYASQDTEEQLVREMSRVGIAATIGYGAYSGSGSFSRSVERQTMERKEVVVIDGIHFEFSQLMNPEKLLPVRTKQELQKLGPVGFFKLFGDKYVIGIVRGARLTGRFETYYSTYNERTTISKNLEAAYDYAATHADGKYTEEEAKEIAKKLTSTKVILENRIGYSDRFSSNPEEFFLQALKIPLQAAETPAPLYWILSSYEDIPQYAEVILPALKVPQLAQDLRYYRRLYRRVAAVSAIKNLPDAKYVVGIHSKADLEKIENDDLIAIDNVTADISKCVDELAEARSKKVVKADDEICKGKARPIVSDLPLLPDEVLIDPASSTPIPLEANNRSDKTVMAIVGAFHWHWPESWFGSAGNVEVRLFRKDGTLVKAPFLYTTPFRLPLTARVSAHVPDSNYDQNRHKAGDPLKAIFFEAINIQHYDLPKGFTDADFK